MTKKGGEVSLDEYAVIRTGLVLSRKEALPDENSQIYRTISLKNITEDGQICLTNMEDYSAVEPLKKEYFTRSSDVLLRLSAPYTAVIITEKEAGLLVPSHFAIIRTNKMVDPRYLRWWLAKKRKWFYKIASGGTMMGTISSGYVAQMPFEPPPLAKQHKVGELFELVNREQQLLFLLAVKKKQLIDMILKNLVNNKGETI
jgi:restriction endonuclease S subunit